MTTRRARGEGSLYWSTTRQRWIAEVTIGFDASGKRITRKGAGETKTEAKKKLREVLRDQEDGVLVKADGYTVAHAVEDWLTYAFVNRDENTRVKAEGLCRTHIIPLLGARKLRDLKSQEVEKWLIGRAPLVATSTLQTLRSYLNRAVRRAMVHEKVRRNVVEPCEVPKGRPGRPSKSLTAAQADAVLAHAASDRMYNYVVVAMLSGARTEELRALEWRHLHLEGDSSVSPPVPPYIEVWRSVRSDGDTKTKKSRRTLALPGLCIDALRRQRAQQASDRLAAGDRWKVTDLVFATSVGTKMRAENVRRDFRRALGLVPDIEPDEWTPRELRHSFVSLLSDSGVTIEEISRLVGHSGTSVTELVYRHQIRPVIQTGATAIDRVFGRGAANDA